ncbi:MAG: energy transducer TonB [Elusimicrobia bacterium]|nr:energy transducer TonB [Elusimicrobiota bacterium]
MAAAAEDNLRPYLTASFATHLGLIGAALFFVWKGALQPREVYRIDFIGPTAGIANRNPEAAPGRAAPAASSSRIAPERKAPEFVRRRHQPLPRPSFAGPSDKPEPKPEPVQESAAPAEPAAPAAAPAKEQGGGQAQAQGEGPGANVTSDLPNFPYPWYITQVRSQLWNRWSSRIPHTPGAVVVMFTILRDGSITDLRPESSSGDEAYDYAALTSVQEAAPFAPLPPGFRDRFLNIHVRFTSQ